MICGRPHQYNSYYVIHHHSSKIIQHGQKEKVSQGKRPMIWSEEESKMETLCV